MVKKTNIWLSNSWQETAKTPATCETFVWITTCKFSPNLSWQPGCRQTFIVILEYELWDCMTTIFTPSTGRKWMLLVAASRCLIQVGLDLQFPFKTFTVQHQCYNLSYNFNLTFRRWFSLVGLYPPLNSIAAASRVDAVSKAAYSSFAMATWRHYGLWWLVTSTKRTGQPSGQESGCSTVFFYLFFGKYRKQ